MEIISIGYNFRHGREFSISRPYGLKEHLFLIIRSTALFEINGQQLHVKPNSMILIDKNTPHSFSADSDLFINDWIALSFDTEQLPSSLEMNSFFTSSDATICSELIKLMSVENTSASAFKRNNINSMLQIIFNKLRDNSMVYKTDLLYSNELQEIRNNIYANPREKFTIEKLAAGINLSKSYFQHCYKLCFNTTPIADVINSRIEYSKQLLLSTNFSICEIAEILGYTNDMQFIKQFKAVVKTTPGQYRKEIISN